MTEKNDTVLPCESSTTTSSSTSLFFPPRCRHAAGTAVTVCTRFLRPSMCSYSRCESDSVYRMRQCGAKLSHTSQFPPVFRDGTARLLYRVVDKCESYRPQPFKDIYATKMSKRIDFPNDAFPCIYVFSQCKQLSYDFLVGLSVGHDNVMVKYDFDSIGDRNLSQNYIFPVEHFFMRTNEMIIEPY